MARKQRGAAAGRCVRPRRGVAAAAPSVWPESHTGYQCTRLSAWQRPGRCAEKPARSCECARRGPPPLPLAARHARVPSHTPTHHPHSSQLFDDVWTQFTKLGSPVTSTLEDEAYTPWAAASSEFETPSAGATRVLVVGATGRVGRVLVRKLLLRGYRVTALVRPPRGWEGGAVPADNDAAADAASLPASVRVVYGDVGDYASLRAAVSDADKVVYAAAARTTLGADVARVDAEGPAAVAAALLDARHAAAGKGAKPGSAPSGFKRRVADTPQFEADWSVTHCGPEASGARGGGASKPAADRATVSLNQRSNLVFEGTIRSPYGCAQAGAPLPGGPGSLAACEGLEVRVAADGGSYAVVLETVAGASYASRVTAPLAFTNLRLPFTAFRPLSPGAPPSLDAARVARLAIRASAPPGAFRIEIDRVKALPGGVEPDFVLVSCAGARAMEARSAPPSLDSDDGDGGDGGGLDAALAGSVATRVLAAKRDGEAALRRTGLGYVIVRPGPLVEEPGGYRALVFDQGGRLTSPLSCADAADVCLKALHDPLARNKAFDVAYEAVGPGGLANFELVAHLPDKANNYLSPALAVLEKNT